MRISYQMMFMSFNSNVNCVTFETEVAYNYRAPEFTRFLLEFMLLNLYNRIQQNPIDK